MTTLGAAATSTVAEQATTVTDTTWTAARVRITLAANADGHNYCVLYAGTLSASNGATIFSDTTA